MENNIDSEGNEQINTNDNQLVPIESKKSQKLSKVQLYFIYFLIFSVVGWLLETAFSYYYLGHFTERGFLFGPLCPIYGWGALILILFFRKYKRHNMKLFIVAAIVFSIFEYAVSYGMEALFALKWWDYSKDVLNLNGRVSIFYSFSWGIIAILFINVIFPFFKKKVNLILSKIPYPVQLSISYMLFAMILVDLVFSCIKYMMI